jgi:hypothetical protein
MSTLKVGDRIKVQADDVLGTPAAMATIREVHSWGYTVHIDEDDDEWEGPVNFKGEVLCDMP